MTIRQRRGSNDHTSHGTSTRDSALAAVDSKARIVKGVSVRGELYSDSDDDLELRPMALAGIRPASNVLRMRRSRRRYLSPCHDPLPRRAVQCLANRRGVS